MGIATPGISHWFPDPAERPEMVDLTVGGLLDRSVELWPDHEAIVFSSYEDMGISARCSSSA